MEERLKEGGNNKTGEVCGSIMRVRKKPRRSEGWSNKVKPAQRGTNPGFSEMS